MNSVAGRALYRLIMDNLFVSAASFECGADVPMIAYPWGSLNYRSQDSDGAYISMEAPDYKAFRNVGLAMQE